MHVPLPDVRHSLRLRLFLTFASFLVAIVVPLTAILILVNTAYRDLSRMQSHQTEISHFITATDSAHDDFSRYLYRGEEKYRQSFLDQMDGITADIDNLDRELPRRISWRCGMRSRSSECTEDGTAMARSVPLDSRVATALRAVLPGSSRSMLPCSLQRRG